MTRISSIARMLAAASALAISATANGQESPSPRSSSELEQIIVTASRRSENLQKVAIPVSAISGKALESLGVVQPQDLNKTVPGLALSPVGGTTQVYLRGVGTFSTQNYADSAVAFNVDGVFVAFPAEIAGHFFDLERVEVLKGPQGTLYGRNASAGAINLITRQPAFKNSGEFTIEGGTHDLRRITGALNLALNDTVALRVAGQLIRRDGYFDDGTGNERSESARAQLRIEPSSALSAVLAVDYTHVNDRGIPYVPMPPADADDRWAGPSSAASNRDIVSARTNGVPLLGLPPGIPFPLLDANSYQKNKIWGARATVKWDFGPATLTVIPAYRDMSSDALIEPGFLAYTETRSNEKSFEARLSGRSGALDWILGGYYFRSEMVTSGDTFLGVSTQSFFSDVSNTSKAAFADATFALNDRLKVVAGVRHTKESKDQEGTAVIFQFPMPPFVYFYPGSATFSDWSGKVGINFEPTPRNLIYASVSNGFKAGGFNQDSAPNSFRPEKLTAFTLGSKNRFFDGKLQANAEFFYWRYKNHQENVLAALNAGGFAPVIRNIGKSSLKGANLDLQYQPTQNDLFSAQLEYLDATFDSFRYFTPISPIPGVTTTCDVQVLPPVGPGAPPSANVDCSGKPFTRAPKWSAVLGYQRIFPLATGARVVASVHSQLASASFAATDYIGDERQKGYSLTDLSLGYEAAGGAWSLFGHVRNVENRAVYTGAFQHPFIPGKAFGTIRPPRTASIVFNVKF